MPAPPPPPEVPTGQPEEASAPSDTPSIRFYHSEDLRVRTLAILAALEEAPDPTRHRDELAAVVLELTDSGMDYFFVRPLKLAKTGFMTEQTAQVGMGAVKRVMAPVIRKIIGRMDRDQLLTVSDYLRRLME